MSDGLRGAFIHGRPALVAYVMAGYPDRAGSLDALRALVDGGADLIELGVPYADPLADGPVIREAADVARSANPGGFGLAETIDLAAEFLAEMGEGAPPLALMTYLNPLMRMGLPRVAEAIRSAGIGGVIVPDLPPDMAPMWLTVSSGIDTVFLAAPTSTPERLSKVGEMSRGFVYCVSTTGVTGERTELPNELATLVGRVKASTTLPVAVGFGVSTPEQAAIVARSADGVVVGSALVRRQHDAGELRALCRELADAVHGVV
ncbi:MAG: tryptophan synthase subunit alpha [Actinobacteria bacterium HGW-Actinobacteria-7]|nr:MAG: tryptophan synthase subunit alpha [Actinobacteria bacterium HGW-Actinobacteria-7]